MNRQMASSSRASASISRMWIEPMTEQVREAFADGDRERAFWAEHRAEFMAAYPKQVVAVRDGAVIAVSNDLFELQRELHAKGLNMSDLWVEYFDPEPRRLSL